MSQAVVGQNAAEGLIQHLATQGPGNVVPLTYAASVTLLEPASGSIQTITLTGNITFTFPAPVAGGEFTAIIKQDATGSRVATWAATSGSVVFSSASKTLSTTANAVDTIQAWSDGTNWYVNLFKGFG